MAKGRTAPSADLRPASPGPAAAFGAAFLYAVIAILMGLLPAIHLGFVFGLFITLPYGEFVHGLCRHAALARYARERAGASSD